LVPENKFLSELILIIDFDSGLSGRFAWNGLKKLEEDWFEEAGRRFWVEWNFSQCDRKL
jgi:hypothetical protein